MVVADAVPSVVIGDVVGFVEGPSVIVVSVVWSSKIDRVDPCVVVSVVGGDVVPSVVVGDVVSFVDDIVVFDIVADVVPSVVVGDADCFVDVPSVIVGPVVWSSTID